MNPYTESGHPKILYKKLSDFRHVGKPLETKGFVNEDFANTEECPESVAELMILHTDLGRFRPKWRERFPRDVLMGEGGFRKSRCLRSSGAHRALPFIRYRYPVEALRRSTPGYGSTGAEAAKAARHRSTGSPVPA